MHCGASICPNVNMASRSIHVAISVSANAIELIKNFDVPLQIGSKKRRIPLKWNLRLTMATGTQQNDQSENTDAVLLARTICQTDQLLIRP